MNKLLFVFVGLSLLLLGCVGAEEATPSPTAIPSAVPTLAPSETPASLLTPIELEYEVNEFFGSGPEGKATMTYWFEEEATCSGRKALNGVYSVLGSQIGNGESVWAKTTYYYEDGELASTEFYQKSGLVFESSKAIQAPMIPNFIQELFAAAGVDFASSEVWDSTKPLVLKDVSVFGGSKGNISIVNEGEGNGAVPCTEFALYSQGSPYAVIACATKPTEETPYSITVYVEQGDDWPAEAETLSTWKLKKAPSKQASGESALLECIDFVRCDYVENPTVEEAASCEANSGLYYEVYDENDCIKSVECTPRDEIALTEIHANQDASCEEPSQDLIDAAASCMSGTEWGLTWMLNEYGCIESVECN